MRMLLRWEIGLEAGNEAIRTGKIAEFNRALMERVQPESAYFGTENGRRTGLPVRASGAVIGKALGSLDSGRGLLPVLVTLQ
jgi:hypothetical protein